MKIVDGAFDYRDPSYNNDSSCRLRVYLLPDRIHLVIATELEENQGPSVTNSAEAWAREAVKEYGVDPARTYFIEHYNRGSYDPPRRIRHEEGNQTYDFVEFTWHGEYATAPKWRPGTKAEIEKLIGEPLDD